MKRCLSRLAAEGIRPVRDWGGGGSSVDCVGDVGELGVWGLHRRAGAGQRGGCGGDPSGTAGFVAG